ncbi:IS3 family transposase [Brevibacterium sp. JNUCC-42]|nr:IS3 family transposase [Brevibacterium sp. JNUCC-42]
MDEYIHYYNNERIQGKLNYLSPVEYRQQVG